jgi:hypothetical protein
VLALALGTRLGSLAVLAPAALVGDEEYYWRDYAEAITRGQLLTFDQQIRPPLWGSVLVLPYALLADPMAGRVFGALVGALACLAVYLLARAAYGERAGFAAGMVQALLPEHVLFSTYLWSEILFGLLILLGCLVFFRPQGEGQGRRRALVASALLGLALLSKEFAVIPFTALVLVLFRRKAGVRAVALSVLLFIIPAAAYSLASSVKNGRWFFLSRAAAANLGQTYLIPFRPQDDLGAQLSRWLAKVKTRSPAELADNAATQVAKLWGFHSFCTWRLSTDAHRPGGYVGGPFPRTAVFVSIAYALVFVLGLIGLAAATGELKWFSVASLLLLTSTGAIGYLVSRFRIPFLFVLAMHAGLALSAPGRTLAALKGRTRVWIVIAAAIALMAYGGVTSFGYWG